MGSWAAARLAARGASVALLDQFDPGHERGSSHGDGRIYRLAYAEDVYVDMMLLSLRHWEALQAHAGESLMATTGGMSIGRCAMRGGDDDRLMGLQRLYEQRGFVHEQLDAASVNERFPQFALPEGTEALYQPDMGVLFATKCVKATWKYAGGLGAELQPFTPVVRLASDGGGVVVTTSEGEDIRGSSVVLAPGPWLSGLAQSLLGLEVPTRVTAETVSYFAPRAGSEVDHSYKSMPVFMTFWSNGLGNYGYYGLPEIDIPGVKISAHYCGPLVDPVRRPASTGGPGASPQEEAEAAARIAAVVDANTRGVADLCRGLEATPFLSQQCLYTETADHDYILDSVPSLPRVVLAGGGSGHAFKMGPAIGEACACLALGEPPPFPLEKFRLGRLLRPGLPALGSGLAPRK